jgi:hypothetical protein
MIGLLTGIIGIILKLLPSFIKNVEDRERAKKNLLAALARYEKGVTSAAEIRKVEAEEDKELAVKWEERWGNKPVPPPPTPENSKIIVPNSVNVGVPFVVKLENVPVGAQVFVDEQYLIYTVGTAKEFETVLNTAKDGRTMDVKVDTKWVYSVTFDVKK